MQLTPPPVVADTTPVVITREAPAPTPAARTIAASIAAATPSDTKAGDGVLQLLPGDAPRSLSAAVNSVREAVRDLFGNLVEPGLPTNGGVDLSRYAGKWYELARLPVRFQDDRTVSTAEYSVRPDGKVGVLNTAYLGDRVDARITGTATPVDGSSNDRLRVRFGGLLRFIPVPKEGNYWVIKTADDYSMALVGTPDRKFLWLLARDEQAWGSQPADDMVARAKELGFDTDKLLVADWDTRQMRA